MAIREILTLDKHEADLRKKSEPVQAVNRRVKKLIQDLKDTLLDRSEGIGLAAPQIGVHSQIVLVRLGAHSEDGEEAGPPVVLINPEIIEADNEERDFDGCLSIPGVFGDTVRPHRLRVKGLNEWGKPFDEVFEGFDAVVVHHEIDHLEGILFIDRIASVDDLYQIRENDQGEIVRVPVSRS